MNRFLRTTIPIGMILATSAIPVAVVAGDAETLHELFADRHEWEMRESPEEAMRLGNYKYAHRIKDNSPAACERRHGETLAQQKRLAEIDRERLNANDLVSCELFALRLEEALGEYRFRTWVMPVGQRWGPHQRIPQMADGVRFANAPDYENYIRRLKQLPGDVDDTIDVMKIGLAEGRTPARITLEGIPAQLRTILEPGGLDALAEPFARMPAKLRETDRQTLPRRFEYETLPEVRKALERFQTYFVEEYLPNTREDIAVSSLPGGAAFYAHQLRMMTTTNMTAREIHRLGLSEVARIRAEMMVVIRRTDFLESHPDLAEASDDDLFEAFVRFLRTDARFYYDRPEELLAAYRDICKRVDAWLPKLFGTLPRLPYGVKEMPAFLAPYSTTAYYEHGSIENAEPGYFVANTYALDQRPRYEMIALAMHEAVPGHHLQVALAQEQVGVPMFRRNSWFTAFGEGWALYSERLGIDMGLYEDPYDDFGRLLYEMWRACRLVVDPGMHSEGWTREQAIGYLIDNTALSELNIQTEIDRYIAWPGQACAYKIGELRIRALRQKAEEALRDRFDVRAFHDVVLGAGSVPLTVPLTVLDRRVRDWIRSHPGGAVYD